MQTGQIDETLEDEEQLQIQPLKESNIKNNKESKMDLPKGGLGVNRKISSKPRLSVPSGHHENPSSQHSYSNQIQIQSYLHRIFDVQQMDIQSAVDQMQTLIFTTTPQRIYKTSYYRKQTKNHWARDDPAFVVLQVLFLICSSISFCIAFRMVTFRTILFFLFHSVVINWFLVGVLISSIGRIISIQYLTVHQSNHVRQYVEWLYAFDIHCNAFFPLFILLYVVQFFLLPFVLGKSLFALFLSNTLYAAAFSIYFYVTHLGYRALPFLSNTEVFLFPIVGVLALYLINLIGYPFGFGWNASRVVANLYFDGIVRIGD